MQKMHLTTHPGASPTIQCVLLLRPDTRNDIGSHQLQFSRELNAIAIGVVYHEEKIVAGPMTARPKENGDPLTSEFVRPVADIVPCIGLVTVVVPFIVCPTEKCQ